MKKLSDIGIEAARGKLLHNMAEWDNITDEEVFDRDAIIYLMKRSWWDDKTLKNLSRPTKVSIDKIGLIGEIVGFILKALGSPK